jgi:hypothetical protein
MAKKVIVEIEVKNAKAIKSTDKLKKSVKDVGKETKKSGEASEKAFGKLDGMTGGMITKFKGLTRVVGGSTKGFKALRIAVVASGIGALVIGVLALVQAFKRSEEGQNKFAKIMGVIGAVVNQVLDVFANLGSTIISVFENPKKAFQDFKKSLKENITNRIESLIDTFGFLGSAIKKVFKLDFEGAMDDAKKAGSSYIDTMTGVKDSINKAGEAIGGFIDETKKEGNIAASIADKRAKATKLERKLIVERAAADQKIAELRFKSEQRDKFTAKQRKEFLMEASALAEDISNQEITAAKLRLEAQLAENELGLSTTQDKQKAADLEAKLIGLTTSKLTLQKRLQTSITTFAREEQAIKDAKKVDDDKKDADKLLKEDADAKKLATLKKGIRDAEAVTEDEKRALEIIKIQEHYAKLIELAELNGLDTAELKLAREEKIKEIDTAKEAKEKEKRDAKDRDELNQFEKLEAAKMAAKQRSFDQLLLLVGAESKIGKALLLSKQLMAAKEMLLDLGVLKRKATNTISEATMDGAKSGSSVATGFAETLKLGFPAAIPALIGYAATAAGIVSGVVSAVGKTKGIAASIGGGGGGGGGGGDVAIPKIQAPSFNIVGSSGTNQLASAIGGQSQQPIKAFVVSGDVTTAQSLERNIVEGASLG